MPALASCGENGEASSESPESKGESSAESSKPEESQEPESKGILPEKDSYKLLFIGNSATSVNDIPGTLAMLCNKLGMNVTVKSIVPGGYTIEQHSNNQAVYTEIEKGYDAVFVQENATAIIPGGESAKKSLAAIKRIGEAVNKSGAKFCFYVRPPYGKELEGVKNFDQCIAFDEHFTPAKAENNAECVYVNRSFAYAIKNLSFNVWGPDNAHTSTHGGYLIVCTFFATVFGRSATELDTAYGLSLSDAKLLQEAADKIALEGVIPWEQK